MADNTEGATVTCSVCGAVSCTEDGARDEMKRHIHDDVPNLTVSVAFDRNRKPEATR